MKKSFQPLILLSAMLMTVPASAAFIVNAATSDSNFSFGGDTTAASSSIASAAVGVGGSSLFGGNGTTTDTYVFSYTPGTDADNFSPAAGSLLGSTTGFGTELASGVAGGGSGTYNVYWTAPASTNVNAAGSIFTLQSDGGDVVTAALDGNNGGTGPDLDGGPAFVGGANNSWLLIGTVTLTAGNTYTVTQESVVNSFVSMRSAGVMWEAVASAPEIPEPGSAVLLAGMVGLGILKRRK